MYLYLHFYASALTEGDQRNNLIATDFLPKLLDTRADTSLKQLKYLTSDPVVSFACVGFDQNHRLWQDRMIEWMMKKFKPMMYTERVWSVAAKCVVGYNGGLTRRFIDFVTLRQVNRLNSPDTP